MPPSLMPAPLRRGIVYSLDLDFTRLAPGFYDPSALQSAFAGRYPHFSLIRCYTPQDDGTAGIGNGSGLGYSARFADQGETVQSSPTSLIASAKDTQSNVAAIGNKTSLTSKRGLVVLGQYANPFSTLIGSYQDGSPDTQYRRSTSGFKDWNASRSCVETYPYPDSPDGSGTGATGVAVTKLSDPDPTQQYGYAPYYNSDVSIVNALEECTMTWWSKGPDSSQSVWIWATLADALGIDSSGVNWHQVEFLRPASVGTFWSLMSPCDTRQPATVPPTGIAPQNVVRDYHMLTYGRVVREVIPTIGDTRPGDRPTYSIGSELIASNGQIKVYARFSPYHASSTAVIWAILGAHIGRGTSAAYYLFSWGVSGTTSTSYAYIRASDLKLVVRIEGGTEYVSTNAMSWSRDDEIELYVAVGNGVASVAKWRVVSDVAGTLTGSAWIDLVLSTVPDVPNPGSGPLALLHDLGPPAFNSDSRQLTARHHRISTIYAGAPSGT